MMKGLHWLNADTAAGAIATSLFMAHYLGVTVPWPATAALGLTVLSIYNFDHLMDARQVPCRARAARHRFYQVHFRRLVAYQAVLLLLLLLVVWWLPTAVLRVGVMLGGAVLLYFLWLFGIRRYRFWLKETIIALLFVAGTLLAPVVVAWPKIDAGLAWLAALLFLIAQANTWLFAWYDYDLDKAENRLSVAHRLGRRALRWFIRLTLVLAVVAGGLALSQGTPEPYLWIMLGMTLVLAVLLWGYRLFARQECFRWLGELIFVLPALIWLC